eukprot:3151014-Amphidinium_carterae.1
MNAYPIKVQTTPLVQSLRHSTQLHTRSIITLVLRRAQRVHTNFTTSSSGSLQFHIDATVHSCPWRNYHGLCLFLRTVAGNDYTPSQHQSKSMSGVLLD